MKKAFTLAEVLIVLGIVGVIAALTLPSLITNYKVKVLEARFKKADAVLQQALLKTANEVGYDSFSNLSTPSTNDELDRMLPEINKAWENQYTGATRISKANNYLFHRGVRQHDIFGNALSSSAQGYFPKLNDDRIIITKDGTSFSYFAVSDTHNVKRLRLILDTNGPFIGPNRWGHDIFSYNSYWFGTANMLCDPSITNSNNQDGCFYYAHRGVNPSGNSNSYWDILYKPYSYWQKSDK